MLRSPSARDIRQKLSATQKKKLQKNRMGSYRYDSKPVERENFRLSRGRKKCYENFDAIVCVAETMKEAFIQKYGMAKKVHVLYNPIDFDSIIEKSKEKNNFDFGNGMKFILAGSFVKVKGFERFVNVCERLKNDGKLFRFS